MAIRIVHYIMFHPAFMQATLNKLHEWMVQSLARGKTANRMQYSKQNYVTAKLTTLRGASCSLRIAATTASILYVHIDIRYPEPKSWMIMLHTRCIHRRRSVVHKTRLHFVCASQTLNRKPPYSTSHFPAPTQHSPNPSAPLHQPATGSTQLAPSFSATS